MTKTIIQITDETPYKVFKTYDFLYEPSASCILTILNKNYNFQTSTDRIDEDGNITRYIQFYPSR